MDCMCFRFLELLERPLSHRLITTQLVRPLDLPDKPNRSSNLGSFRTKA